MTAEPDKQLVERCLRGDADAWHAFIQRFSPLVYYAVQRVIHTADADELADLHNEIFLSLMEHGGRKLRQYEGKNGCSVSTWIRVIAVRASIDHLKKQKRTIPLSDDQTLQTAVAALAAEPAAPARLTDDEERRILKELIDELPAPDRLFLRLFYYDEVPAERIAMLLRTTTNAVYSRGNYIREKLRDALHKKLCKDDRR